MKKSILLSLCLKHKSVLKVFASVLCVFSLVLLVILLLANSVVSASVATLVYDDVKSIPYRKVGVLLGTSPFLKSGRENLYFKYRIQAAFQLYNAGKISYILVSGDNRKEDYNEPEAIKQALLSYGIPEDKIVLDYAGFRTLDSIIRSHEIFGVAEPLIISQRFHNERAVYIALRHGINAIAFNAKDVDAYNGFKTNVRELFARVKVFIDIALNIQPHFLGKKNIIVE